MKNYISEKEVITNLIKTDKFKDVSMERIRFIEKRLYCKTNPFTVYSGLTGALEAATFKGNMGSKRLGKWRDKMRAELGVAGQEAYLSAMADFGTLLHECLVRIKRDGLLNWQDEQDYAYQFFEASAKKNGMTPNFNVIRSQVFEFNKAAASLLQFVYDNVIEIYGIEAMAFSDEYKIATPCDLVCKVKEKKGEVIVSINLKTSEQFGNHHWEQVAVEMYLWNNSHPDFEVEKTGLWRPKDWNMKKGIPTYEFELMEAEDQQKTLKAALQRLDLCLNDEECTYMNFPAELPSFSGITKAGEAPKIINKTLEEIYNEFQEKQVEELA